MLDKNKGDTSGVDPGFSKGGEAKKEKVLSIFFSLGEEGGREAF